MGYFDYGKPGYCVKCDLLVSHLCPVCHSATRKPTDAEWERLTGRKIKKKICEMKKKGSIRGRYNKLSKQA